MAEARTATWHRSGFGDEVDPDPAVQVAVLQAVGANNSEVRSAWDSNDVDISDGQLDRSAALLAEKEMGASAMTSPIGKVDVEAPVGCMGFASLEPHLTGAFRLGDFAGPNVFGGAARAFAEVAARAGVELI